MVVIAIIGVVALWPLVQSSVGSSSEAQAQQIEPLLGFNFTLQAYFDVSSSFTPSESGYGGPGFSGGTGDALLRIVNAGNFEGLPSGFLCANVYVFDDAQELQECCSCPISPDGVLTLSTINNLTGNPLFASPKLGLGTITIVGSSKDVGSSATFTCSGAEPASTGNSDGSNGLQAWLSHADSIASNNPGDNFAFITSTSVERLPSVPLDNGEAGNMITQCQSAVAEGSGRGICNCGTGESLGLSSPKSQALSPQSALVNPKPFAPQQGHKRAASAITARRRWTTIW